MNQRPRHPRVAAAALCLLALAAASTCGAAIVLAGGAACAGISGAPNPLHTTISQLAALSAPQSQPVRVAALIQSARLDPDGGISLELADPFATATTVSAVIPSASSCSTAGARARALGDAQADFVNDFGLPAPDTDTPVWRYADVEAIEAAPDSGQSGSVQLSPVVGFRLTTMEVPVHAGDLDPAIEAYGAYVVAGLADLSAKTIDLQQAVDGGDLDDARNLWLPAHLSYERLGAAYDAFGDFDDKINGRPDGLPDGVDDPNFTGFLRLEYGLWNGQGAAELGPIAHQLASEVSALAAAFRSQDINPVDLPLRAHEILENALQFELTADTDEGSGTNLATVSANVDGTREVLATLQPLLDPRQPQLWQTVSAGLEALRTQLDAYDAGAWTPLEGLSRSEREQLNGAAGALLEQLAVVPDALELVPSA